MTPGAIGLAFAVGGSGGVLGAAAAGKLAKRWSRGGVLVAAPFVAACGGLPHACGLAFACRCSDCHKLYFCSTLDSRSSA